MSKQKLIIDTDPGIDDAMAIHYAFAHEALDLIGLTTIFGNVFVEQATRNALWLTDQASRPIPVSQGAATPLAITPNAPSHYVHGDEGFGDLPAMITTRLADPRPAHIFLADTIRAYPGEVILCPIGPLTNIARLLDHDPAIAALVKKLVIMGGAVDCAGNVSAFAEANIWNDPHAAERVFAADWDMELIGLDVTSLISCDADDFLSIAKEAPDIGGFLERISQFYINFYHSIIGRHVCLMHDPSAVISITDETAFEYENIPLEVVCSGERIGATIRSQQKRRPVRVAKAVNAKQVQEIFLDICKQSDKIKKQSDKIQASNA